ncbi:glycosyltransferase [Hymenobacter sediminis]|uniref:glycosyltransferase n=1 Tax=Hymenobacter sediminis TaxID=2218621 RepID=UPI000DA6B20B|nr:glycosyltransferase [Hymenobacter sediminis]RPD46895.1 glycosyltransferase [Hymenobacter sediminis]
MVVASLVSVVIPCYNAEKYIAATLQSVLQQTYPAVEVLVVDDGSKDASAKIVADIARTQPQVRLHSKPNSGVADSRNVGISLAQGEYIAFLDADDLFEPENLARKVAYLEQHPHIGLVHSAEERFQSETNQTVEVIQGKGGQVLPLLLEMSTTVIHSPSSVVVRRSVLDEAGHFDTKLSTSADWEIWVRLARCTEFGYLTETLVRYRIHGQQMHNNIPLMERDMLYAFTKLHQEGSYFSSEAYYRQCLANLYLILAACYRGDMHDNARFLRFLAKSVSTDVRPLWRRLRRSGSAA